jgi:hypothetical protein
MDLTEAMQLLPEQSTAAVVIHHPEAKYYAVRGAAGAGVEDRSGAPRESAGGTTEGTANYLNGGNAETLNETAALQRASKGEISLAEARADT